MRWLRFLNLSMENFTEYNPCQWITVNKTWSTPSIIDFMLTGPLLTVVICAGICGGFFCCLTFWRSSSRLRIYCYLLALAVWDLFYILTAFFLYNLRTLIYIEMTFFGSYTLAVPFLYYLCTVARTGSVWTVLIIALERYMALCHPFKFKTMDSQQRISVALTMVGFFSFLYSAFRYFEIRTDFCYELTSDEYVPTLTSTWLRSSYSYWLFYRVIGGSLFYSLVPFVTLFVLTIRITVEIKKSGQLVPLKMKNGANLNINATAATSEENHHSFLRHSGTFKDKTNRWMHVAMITKFIICHTFPTILDIWELAQPAIATEKHWRSWIFMSHTSILLVTLNSSLNFFIYFLTSARFRKDCRISIHNNKRLSCTNENRPNVRIISSRYHATLLSTIKLNCDYLCRIF